MALWQTLLESMQHPAIASRRPGRPPASRRRASDLIIATTIAVFLLASIIEIGMRWLAAASAP